LGAFSSGGEVLFRGRADGQVKIRGFRVELEEVESVLNRIPGITRSAVALEERAGEEARLLAFVQLARPIPTAEMRAAVAAELPRHMVPADVVPVDAFPLTPNGKVDRRQLLLAAPTPEAPVALLGEEASLLDRVVALWQAVLKTRVGVDDNFFELGGYSMLAVKLLAGVEERFGKNLAMRTLLGEAATPRHMATLLREAGGQEPPRSLVALKPTGSHAPVFWMPGGGGLSVIAFRSISVRLGDDRPVYGLEAVLDAAYNPASLSEVAARYVEEIRRFQPRGPYHLFGFSLGSFTAFEMGVQLSRMGQEVATLAVFDTPIPGRLSRLQRWEVFAERALHQARVYSGLPRTEVRARVVGHVRALWGDLRARVAPPPAEPLTWFDRVDQRNQRLIRAYANGKMPTFDGRMTVVLAQRSSHAGVRPGVDARRFWRLYAQRGIDVRTVQSNHLAMLEPPDVDALAAVLRDVLRR
jgi:thioesterase domain-containing protein